MEPSSEFSTHRSPAWKMALLCYWNQWVVYDQRQTLEKLSLRNEAGVYDCVGGGRKGLIISHLPWFCFTPALFVLQSEWCLIICCKIRYNVVSCSGLLVTKQRRQVCSSDIYYFVSSFIKFILREFLQRVQKLKSIFNSPQSCIVIQYLKENKSKILAIDQKRQITSQWNLMFQTRILTFILKNIVSSRND